MSVLIPERRAKTERRRSVLRALWRGNFARRRVAPRRGNERHTVVTDWFHPQWLGIGMLILLLCAFDAVLTLTLISHGAYELNPLMAPLVGAGGPGFVAWKLGLTAAGVVMMTVLARLRAFGRTVGFLLYVVLAGYAALVAYELFLLRNIPLD